jgi:hypothetical protein
MGRKGCKFVVRHTSSLRVRDYGPPSLINVPHPLFSISYSTDTGGVLCQGLMRPETEAKHSSPSNAKAKNNWIYTSTFLFANISRTGTSVTFTCVFGGVGWGDGMILQSWILKVVSKCQWEWFKVWFCVGRWVNTPWLFTVQNKTCLQLRGRKIPPPMERTAYRQQYHILNQLSADSCTMYWNNCLQTAVPYMEPAIRRQLYLIWNQLYADSCTTYETSCLQTAVPHIEPAVCRQ